MTQTHPSVPARRVLFGRVRSLSSSRLGVVAGCLLVGCALPGPLWAAWPGSFSIREAHEIRVDGRLSDWPPACRLDLDEKEFVTDGKAYWQGPESLSGRLYLAYDASYLYVAALVRQPHVALGSAVPDGRPSGDALEVILSSGWDDARSPGWTRKDVRLTLAPGARAQNPVVWDDLRQVPAPGARLIAKPTDRGYLLEAAIPWTLFPGIRVGQDRTIRFHAALRSGDAWVPGPFFRLASPGDLPAQWSLLRFDGKAEAETPDSFGRSRNLPDAARLEDGIRGARPRMSPEVEGVVLDARGKPVPGARVGFWPQAGEFRCDEKGFFRLRSDRLYDRTRVWARATGLGSVWIPLPAQGPATLRLPMRTEPLWGWGFRNGGGPVVGGTLRLSGAGWLEGAAEATANGGTDAGVERVAAVRVSSTDPEAAARSAAEKEGRSVAYWALLPDTGANTSFWNSLNAYRKAALALKSVRPDAWILSPGLDLADDERWGLFCDFESDTLDMALVRGDFRMKGECDEAQEERMLGEALRFMADAPSRVGSRLDDPVPVALWVRVGAPDARKPTILPALLIASLWSAWAVDPSGPLWMEEPDGSLEVDSPQARVLAMLETMRGNPVRAASYQPNVRVCARRDEDGTLRVLVVNEAARESAIVRMSLSDRKDPVMVEAGLKRRLTFELSSQSLAVVTVSPTGKPAAVWYGHHHVIKGQGPQDLVLH